jgi:ABC-type dipeptide/oligopeptide/nickel transport system ATPase subunit
LVVAVVASYDLAYEMVKQDVKVVKEVASVLVVMEEEEEEVVQNLHEILVVQNC